MRINVEIVTQANIVLLEQLQGHLVLQTIIVQLEAQKFRVRLEHLMKVFQRLLLQLVFLVLLEIIVQVEDKKHLVHQEHLPILRELHNVQIVQKDMRVHLVQLHL